MVDEPHQLAILLDGSRKAVVFFFVVVPGWILAVLICVALVRTFLRNAELKAQRRQRLKDFDLC